MRPKTGKDLDYSSIKGQAGGLPPDFDLASYEFELPPELIAQAPPKLRGTSRLMLLPKTGGEPGEASFADLPALLPEGALVVANNVRVTPVRLFGVKPSGGAVEFLLLTPLPLIAPQEAGPGWQSCRVEGLLRASKAPKPGSEVMFSPDLRLSVISRAEFGRCEVELFWRGDLAALLERLGHMPLPPYIQRPDDQADRERYQTTHANPDKPGAAAAPTAGLHFTPEIRAGLTAKGISWAEVTLYVGYGTFSPLRCRDIREHEMHQEYFEISEKTASAVANAKREGRPIVAVGTTTVRALEGAVAECGEIKPYAGSTGIFIYPGYKFKVVDRLLTNFHLPGSSLVIMVSALAGRERVLAAYRQAVRRGFRFFSYGDAMLIS